MEVKPTEDKPILLIEGEMSFIHPSGDLVLSKITKITSWKPKSETNEFEELKIPDIHTKAKKITIKSDTIATILYIEELKQNEKRNDNGSN